MDSVVKDVFIKNFIAFYSAWSMHVNTISRVISYGAGEWTQIVVYALIFVFFFFLGY